YSPFFDLMEVRNVRDSCHVHGPGSFGGRHGAGCAEPGQGEFGPAWCRALLRAGRPSLRGRSASGPPARLAGRLVVGTVRSEFALISKHILAASTSECSSAIVDELTLPRCSPIF